MVRWGVGWSTGEGNRSWSKRHPSFKDRRWGTESDMRARNLFCYVALAFCLMASAAAWTQEPPAGDAAPPTGPENPRRQRGEGPRGEGQRGPGLIGKIVSIQGGVMQVATPNGQTVAVKITDKTEFRRAREVAKQSDFKVGDGVIVRGDENEDHSWTARMVGGLAANGPGGARGGPVGEMGKDYVVGEVKAIDTPKLTILRSDKVMQTIELTEETSLRKGQDSVTMADVQAGDHVFVRGGLQNNVFVPKLVLVIEPEQWKRMQELGLTGPGPSGGARKNAQAAKPPGQNP
jgi:hypothetical protein